MKNLILSFAVFTVFVSFFISAHAQQQDSVPVYTDGSGEVTFSEPTPYVYIPKKDLETYERYGEQYFKSFQEPVWIEDRVVSSKYNLLLFKKTVKVVRLRLINGKIVRSKPVVTTSQTWLWLPFVLFAVTLAFEPCSLLPRKTSILNSLFSVISLGIVFALYKEEISWVSLLIVCTMIAIARISAYLISRKGKPLPEVSSVEPEVSDAE